jgi:hypothetical protein
MADEGTFQMNSNWARPRLLMLTRALDLQAQMLKRPQGAVHRGRNRGREVAGDAVGIKKTFDRW